MQTAHAAHYEANYPPGSSIKTLLLSIVIALVGVIIVFVALSLAGVDKSVAGPIATAIVGGIPYLRESLEKEGLFCARSSRTVLSFEGFGLSPLRLVLYGTLILFSAMNLAAVFGGVVAGVAGLSFDKGAATIIKGFSVAIVLPAVFLTGRWVGRRSIYSSIYIGTVTILLICILARIATTLIDSILISSEKFSSLIGMSAWEQIGFGIPILFLFGCWGYWRGRRQRLAVYLAYLLRRVSTDTRETIVQLAFQEASRDRPVPVRALTRTPTALGKPEGYGSLD